MARSSSGSSSDEEEDRRSLVPQNDTKHLHCHSSFEISNGAGSGAGLDHGVVGLSSRVRRLCSRKRYLLALSVPVLLIVLFFSLDFGELLRDGVGVSVVVARGPSRAASSADAERMREAELRALYLLRDQQLELLKLWNLTLSSSSAGVAVAPSPTSTLVPSDELRSALLKQIKLNKQIQSALLSSHRSGNMSTSDDGDLSFDATAGVCKKVDRPKDRRTIEWNPKKDRYLFTVCLNGQMSNHLICLEKHMFFAALLGRILILPSAKLDYQYDRVLDIERINQCFGRKVVISYDEFAQTMKNKVKIDRFICYMASPPCQLDEDHLKRLKNMGISLGKIEAAWPEDAKLKVQKKRVVGDIVPKFSSNDEVIAIGDMFYADVEEEWVMQPGGPLAHSCKTVLRPSRLIYVTAQRFVQTFLGSNFVALHFRRHGFLKFCNAKEQSCFFPIPQAADCILRIVEKANAPVVYLSTDAADSETNLLQSLVAIDDKQIPLVKRPGYNSAEKWDSLLYRNHLDNDRQVEAMLDKTICALANVFIGAPGSTFTEDILRLRRGWESASHCDEYLCQGQLPNYVAENT